MITEYSIKDLNYIAVAHCTRILNGMLPKSRPITTQDIYDEFEKTYHWVETDGMRLYPNDDYKERCKKIYQGIYDEAVWRLKKILDKGKGKSQERFFVIKDSPQNQDEKIHIYTQRDLSAFEANNLDALECAFIIDDILSLGEPQSNDDLFKIFCDYFLLIGGKDNIEESVKEKLKQSITYINKELKWKKISDMLVLSQYPKDKRKYTYQYKEKGFSAFKAPKPENVSLLEVEFESFVRNLYKKNETSKLKDNASCIEPEWSLERLLDILKQVDVSFASETGSKEKDFYQYLSEIESIIENKPCEWLVKCDEKFRLLFDKYKDYITQDDYARLWVLYADFVYDSGLSKEFKESVSIENGWFETVADSLETAVNIARTIDNTESFINYALKYAHFMTQYGQPELYDKVEHLYRDIFSLLDNHPQYKETIVMAYALRSFAMLCYYRENIGLCIEKLEQAKELSRTRMYITTGNGDVISSGYLNEYLFATKNLADIFFDFMGNARRDINRSIHEYKEIIENYCSLADKYQSLDYEFIHLVYKRLAILYNELKNHEEEEFMLEKCVTLSLFHVQQECKEIYIENIERDIMAWATVLRKVHGTTNVSSYEQILNKYMQLKVELSLVPSMVVCEVVPQNYFPDLIVEINLFKCLQACRSKQKTVEDKVCLAESLEKLADLHTQIICDDYDIIEKEYSEAFAIYQTINHDNIYTFTMVNLLGKLSKNFISQRKNTEAERIYNKLYGLLCAYMTVEDETLEQHGIDIAKLLADYVSFLACNKEYEKAISVCKQAISLCDKISPDERNVFLGLTSESPGLSVALPSKGLKCNMLNKMAKMYEYANRFEEADSAYRKSIEFCLQEEKESPGAFVIYIILQLEDYAEMLKDCKSYEEADRMIAHYGEIIHSAPEYYASLIAQLPEFNWIKKAKLSVDRVRETAMVDDAQQSKLLLAENLGELAELQCIYREYDDAKGSYLEIIDILQEMEKDRPGWHTNELARSYSSLAFVYKELGLKNEAIESYDDAKSLYKKLAVYDTTFNADIAKCLKAQAELYES